jgi:hypothetical protein
MKNKFRKATTWSCFFLSNKLYTFLARWRKLLKVKVLFCNYLRYFVCNTYANCLLLLSHLSFPRLAPSGIFYCYSTEQFAVNADIGVYKTIKSFHCRLISHGNPPLPVQSINHQLKGIVWRDGVSTETSGVYSLDLNNPPRIFFTLVNSRIKKLYTIYCFYILYTVYCF